MIGDDVSGDVRSAVLGGRAFNFAATLGRALERYPDKVAVIEGDRTTTYRELAASARKIAAGLRHHGVTPGDRVGLLMANQTEFIELFFGALWAGGVVVPVNYRLALPEVRYVIEHSGLEILFVGAHASAGDLAESVTVIDAPGDTFDEFCERGEIPDCHRAGAFDLQRIMYTSGTTGHPKGVMIPHAAVLWKCLNQIIEFGLQHDDVFLASGPLYHAATLDLPGVGLLLQGGTIVILSKFEPDALLAAVETWGVTCTFLAPSMVNQIIRHPDLERRDLTTLRIIIDGSEKMPEALLATLPRVFPQAQFFDGFGMTETLTNDACLWPGELDRKLGSVGKPTLTMECRVVDEADQDVPPSTPGELVVRGPKLCSGYWRDEEATATAFRNGWFHTVDDEGFISIVDRKKDMIIRGGENVASGEVERVLYEHPGVIEAAVVGRADSRWGEVPVAFIVASADAEVGDEALSSFCRERLAGFKVPAEFIRLPALPRNPAGKVIKHELRSSLRPQASLQGRDARCSCLG